MTYYIFEALPVVVDEFLVCLGEDLAVDLGEVEGRRRWRGRLFGHCSLVLGVDIDIYDGEL